MQTIFSLNVENFQGFQPENFQQWSSLNDALENDVVCQRRTSNRKQFVFLHGDSVIKGPYKEERVRTLLDRANILKEWKANHIVYPTEVLTTPEGIFVKYPNLALGYPIEWEDHKESFSDYKYRVLKRHSLIKLSDYMKLEESEWMTQVLESMMYSLIGLTILGTGDMHTANILVDGPKRMVYIIDYEENRGELRDDIYFMFSKRPGKEITNQWNPNMPTILTKILAHLKIPQNQIQGPKFEDVMTLLEKWSTTAQSPAQTSPLNMEFQQLTLNAPINTQNSLGRMKWGGPFSGTMTYSGFTPDVMKSALQKYIRRGIVDKALYAAFELYRMGEISGGVAVQTNCLNRLRVIGVEDIGLANWSLVISALTILQEDKRNPEIIAAITQMFVLSEKARLGSHMYRAYATPQGQLFAKEKGLKVTLEVTPEEEKKAQEFSQSQFWKQGDPEELRSIAGMFRLRLQEKSRNVITWMQHYEQMSENRNVMPRNRKKNPMVILWRILDDFLTPEVIKPLEWCYFKLTESRPFLVAAISAVIYSVQYQKMDVESHGRAWLEHPSLQLLLKSQYQFTVDDYVIDKHTKQGMLEGANREKFVKEGAHVENQSKKYFDETLAEIYEKS